MSPWVAGLVLASAFLHATWNALLKGGSDKLRSVAVMALAESLVSLPWVLFLPIPREQSWPYIGLSVALHVAYNLLLAQCYHHGDLGVSYPVARGSSPVLVAAGAAMTTGERLDGFTLLGISLVCAGIIALAREIRGNSLVPAFLTGVTIAAYTVVDGLGSRVAGNAWAYSAWMFLAMGPAMLPFWRKSELDAELVKSAAGGVISLIAYAIVIWAASVSPMGPVSALRESSVVVAAILGWLFFGERLGRWRLAACFVVALGTACLGLKG